METNVVEVLCQIGKQAKRVYVASQLEMLGLKARTLAAYSVIAKARALPQTKRAKLLF